MHIRFVFYYARLYLSLQNSIRCSVMFQVLNTSKSEVMDFASHSTAQLLCELCQAFYSLGWNMGTGGGVSIQAPESSLIFLSPSGVHKERMQPEDLFVYDSVATKYIYQPPNKKPSASSVLFLWLHEHHGAGAVIHTHSMYSNLVTRRTSVHWKINDQEYIKGIPSYTANQMLQNTDELRLPIIPNEATEDLLLPALAKACEEDPAAACVLVKNHGAYHFGRDIWKCKAQAECLEYLFELDWRINTPH